MVSQLSSADVTREVVYDSLLLIDWAQTRVISDPKHPEFKESNLFLGEKPSAGRVNTFFLLAGASHFAVTRMLEPENRVIWQNVTIGVVLGNVIRNSYYGVDLKFSFK